MNKIHIDKLIIQDRQRKDLGNIDELASSLSRIGQIQPVVVDQNYHLIAGERRVRAAQKLGWVEIAFVLLDQISPSLKQEMELEENLRRKDMTWQEKCLAIVKIHELKVCENALEGNKWGMERTGEMLGISLGHVSTMLKVAERLKDELSPMWKATTVWEALKMIVQENELLARTEWARRLSAKPHPMLDKTSVQLTKILHEEKKAFVQATETGETKVEVVEEEMAPLPLIEDEAEPELVIKISDYVLSPTSDLNRLAENSFSFVAFASEQEETWGLLSFLHTLKDNCFVLVSVPDSIEVLTKRFQKMPYPIVRTFMLDNADKNNLWPFPNNHRYHWLFKQGNPTIVKPPVPFNSVFSGGLGIEPSFRFWEWILDTFTLENEQVLDPLGTPSFINACLIMNRKPLTMTWNEDKYESCVSQLKKTYEIILPGTKFVP